MKRVKSLKELQAEFVNVKTGVAGDTIWSAKALLYLIELLEQNIPSRTTIRAMRSEIQALADRVAQIEEKVTG